MRVLITAEQIADRVSAMARDIDRDFADETPVLIGLLKGSFVFMADLCRAMSVPHHIDFMAIAAYGGGTAPSGAVRLLKDLSVNITGRSVIIVEDIIDSGLTLAYIRRLLLARQPKRLAIATLLDKKSRRQTELPIEYVGFEIGAGFVVGYGLDLAERYRHLPHIAELDVSGPEKETTPSD
ncbi:MAG: hypoxanthine phosphoribosyltransferase [candidate division Zixibacteria bacterium]|nr:hypoxanthine phosphoribosyltransferase [candidate division Zixibacteria bacterium]